MTRGETWQHETRRQYRVSRRERVGGQRSAYQVRNAVQIRLVAAVPQSAPDMA